VTDCAALLRPEFQSPVLSSEGPESLLEFALIQHVNEPQETNWLFAELAMTAHSIFGAFCGNSCFIIRSNVIESFHTTNCGLGLYSADPVPAVGNHQIGRRTIERIKTFDSYRLLIIPSNKICLYLWLTQNIWYCQEINFVSIFIQSNNECEVIKGKEHLNDIISREFVSLGMPFGYLPLKSNILAEIFRECSHHSSGCRRSKSFADDGSLSENLGLARNVTYDW
jgi:hypothetical protein